MKTIPDLLKKNQELIDKAVVDYELIEEFYYSISQDDFNAKYEILIITFSSTELLLFQLWK